MDQLLVGIGIIVLVFGAAMAFWTWIAHTATRRPDGIGEGARSHVVKQILRIVAATATLEGLLALAHVVRGWL
jgi:uncharacterized iron-regulated membrane protein